jgi:hypothetical protein
LATNNNTRSATIAIVMARMSPLRFLFNRPPQPCDESLAWSGGPEAKETTVHEDDPRDVGDDEAEGEALEADIMRADRAFAAESRGTTAEEAVEGEGLDRALAQEQPERTETDEALSVVDDGGPDREDELVGDAVTARDEFAAPEEAALTVRERAPGATDHEDPHPVEQDLPDDDR